MDNEETILSRSILRRVFKEYLDLKNSPVIACGCEEPMSSFLLRNNQQEFYEKMQSFIDKAIELGIVVDTENEDTELRYRLSENPSDFLVLFKHIE